MSFHPAIGTFISFVSCTWGGGDTPDLYDSPGFGAEEVGVKYDESTGGIHYYEGSGFTFPSSANGGDWQGDCDTDQYECKWDVISGDTPNQSSAAEGVWTNMGSDFTLEQDGIAATSQVRISTRDATTLVVINEDDFEMKTE